MKRIWYRSNYRVVMSPAGIDRWRSKVRTHCCLQGTQEAISLLQCQVRHLLRLCLHCEVLLHTVEVMTGPQINDTIMRHLYTLLDVHADIPHSFLTIYMSTSQSQR